MALSMMWECLLRDKNVPFAVSRGWRSFEVVVEVEVVEEVDGLITNTLAAVEVGEIVVLKRRLEQRELEDGRLPSQMTRLFFGGSMVGVEAPEEVAT